MRSSNILPLNSPNSARDGSGLRGYSSPMRVARMDTSPRNDIAPRAPPQAGGSSSGYATPRRYDPSSGSGNGGSGSVLPVLTSPATYVQVPPLCTPSPNAFKRTVWTTPKSPHELPTGSPSSSLSTVMNNCGLQTPPPHNSRSYEDDQQYAYELDEGGDGEYPSYYPGDGDNASYMFNPTSDQVSDSPSSSSSSLLSRLRRGGSGGIDPDKQKHSDDAAQLEQLEYMEQMYNTIQVLNAELEKERQDRHARLAAAGSSIDDEVSAALEYPSMHDGGGHHHHHQYPANASDFFDDPNTSLLVESTPSTSSGSRRSRPLPSQPKRPIPPPPSSQNSRTLSKNQVELCATLGKNAELRIRTKEMEKTAEKASVQLDQAQKQMKMVERRISNREEKLRILMKEKLRWQKELKDMRDQVVEEKMRQVELFRRLETAKRENAVQMEQLEYDLREIHDENQSLRAQVAEERTHITFQAKKLDEVMRQAREEKEKLVSCIAETKYKFKEWKEGEAAALRNSREQAANNVKTEYDLKIARHQEEKQKLREKVKDLEVSLRLMQKDRTLSPLELSLRKATILGSKDTAGTSEAELIEAYSRIRELEALMEHSQEYQKRQENIIKVSEATISRLVQEREVTALENLSAQPLARGLASPMFATDPNNAFASSMPIYSVSSSSPNISAQRDASKRQSYGSVKSPPSHGNPSLSSSYGKPRASSSTTSRIQLASNFPLLSAQYRNDPVLSAQPPPPQVSSASASSFSLMISSPSKLSKTPAVELTQDEKEKNPEPRGHSHRRQDTGIHGIHAVGAKNGPPELAPSDPIDEDVDVEEASELPHEAKGESQDVQMESRYPSVTTSTPSLVVSSKEQFLANEVVRLQKELTDLKTSTLNQEKSEGNAASTLGEPHSIAGGTALDGDEQAEDNVAAADPEATMFDESTLSQHGIFEETEEELESDDGHDSAEKITQEQNEFPPRELEDTQGKDQLQQLDQTTSVQDSISENEDEVKGDNNEAQLSEVSFDETESKYAGADRSEVKNPVVAVHEASADEETFSELRASRVVDAVEKTALPDVSADDEVGPISVPGEASAVDIVSPMEDKLPAQKGSIDAPVSQNEVESSLDSTAASESVNREVEESSAEEQLYEPDASKELVAVTDADFPKMTPNEVDKTLEVDDSIVKETLTSEISGGFASLRIVAPEECNLEAKEETDPVILVGESTCDEEMRQEPEESKRDETPDAKDSIVNYGGTDESGAARESRDAKNPNDGAEKSEESAQVEAKIVCEERPDQSEVQEENSAKDEDATVILFFNDGEQFHCDAEEQQQQQQSDPLDPPPCEKLSVEGLVASNMVAKVVHKGLHHSIVFYLENRKYVAKTFVLSIFQEAILSIVEQRGFLDISDNLDGPKEPSPSEALENEEFVQGVDADAGSDAAQLIEGEVNESSLIEQEDSSAVNQPSEADDSPEEGLTDSGADLEHLDSRAPNFEPLLNDQDAPTENPSSSERGKGNQVSHHRALEQEPAFPQDLLDSTAKNDTASSDPQDNCIRVHGEENVEGEGASASTYSSDQVLQGAVDAEALLLDSTELEANTDLDQNEPAAVDQESERLTTPDSPETKAFAERFVLNVQNEAVASILADQCPHLGDPEDGTADSDESDAPTAVEPEKTSVESAAESALEATVGDGDTAALLVPEQDDQCCEEADDCKGSCADTKETPQAEVAVRPFAASIDELETLTTSSSVVPQESLAEFEFSAVDFVAAVKAEAIAFVTKSVLIEKQMSVDANAKGADIPESGDDEGSANCGFELAYKEEDGVLAIETHCDSAASENPELSQISTVFVEAAAIVSVSGLVSSDSATAAAQPTSADSDLSESEVSEPCGKSVEPAHAVEKVPEDASASVESLCFATEVDIELARELDRIVNTLDAEDSRIASGSDVGIDVGNCVAGPTEPSVDSIERVDVDRKVTEAPLVADAEDVLAELVEACKGEDVKKSDADVVAVEAAPSVAEQESCLVADVAEVSLKLSLEITASALEAYSAAWTTNGVDTGVIDGGVDTPPQKVPVVCENDVSHNDAENVEDTERPVSTNVEAKTECAHEKEKATNRPANDGSATLQDPVSSDFQTEGTEGPSEEEAGADTAMQQEHNADDSRYNSVVRPNSPHEEVCTDESAIQYALEGVVGRLSIIQASRANLLDEVFREITLTTTPDQVNTVEVCQARESETNTIDDPEWCDQLLSEPPEMPVGVSDANTEIDTTTSPAPNSDASSAIEDPDAPASSPATTITDDTLAQDSDAVTSSVEVEVEDSNSTLSGNPHFPDGQVTEDESISASLPQLSTNPDCGDPPPRASSEAATIPASQVNVSSPEHVIDEPLIETVDIEISVSASADGKDSETEPVTMPIDETQGDQLNGSLDGGASTNELDASTQSETDGTAAEQCPGSDVCGTEPIPAKQELTATDPPRKMVESIASLSAGVIDPGSALALEGPADEPKNEVVADPISEAETRKAIESEPAMDEAPNAPGGTTEHYTGASDVDTAVAAATTVTEMQDVETSAADDRPDVLAALNSILDEIERSSIAAPAVEQELPPERTVSKVTWDLPPESDHEKTTPSPSPKSQRTERRRTSRRFLEQSRYASSSEMMRDPTLAAYDAHREQGQPFALLDDNIFSIDPHARHMQHDENDNAKCTDLEIRAKRKNFDQDNHRKSIAYRSIPAFNYAPVLICFQWSDFVVATPISVCNLTDPADKKSWNPASPVKKMRLLAKKGIKLPCGSYVIISAFIRPLEDGNENLRIHIYDSEWVEEFQYDFSEDHLKEYIHEWTGRDEDARLFMTQLEFRREEGGIIIKLPDKAGQEEVKRPLAAPAVAMPLPDGKEHPHHDHSSPQPPHRNSRHSHRPSTSPHVPFLPIQARSLSNLSDSSKREKRHDTDDPSATNDSALSKD